MLRGGEYCILRPMRIYYASSLLASALLVSCAGTERTVTTERVAAEGDDVQRIKDKFAGNFGYSKKGGMTRSQSDQKSQYAGKQFSGPNDFAGKDYTTGQYSSKRWGAKRYAGNTGYAGRTDGSRFQYSPEFVQRQARQGSMVSNAQGERFASNTIDRKTSRANNATRFKFGESNYAKRDNVDDPVIIPWKEQHGTRPTKKTRLSDLNVDDARVIMGRSEGN